MNHQVDHDGLEKVINFTRGEIGRYADYHKHKESMAYVGVALFTGTAGVVLTSADWPPEVWGHCSKPIAAIALTVFWIAVLLFLRFQLQNRRWAALRVAGCERVLVRWATNSIDTSNLGPVVRPPIKESIEYDKWSKLIDWFWPQQVSKPVMDESMEPYYPGMLVNAWVEAEKSGTKAIYHERIIIPACWILYLAMVFRTLFFPN